MKHRKQIGRRIVNIILTMVLTVCLLPIMSITAKADGLEVNLKTNGHGTLVSSRTSGISADESITVTQTPNAGYRFDKITIVSSNVSGIEINKNNVHGTGINPGNLFVDDTSTWTFSYDNTSGTNVDSKDIYVIFEANEECVLTDYTLTTGGDKDKNWQSWNLYGYDGELTSIDNNTYKSPNWNTIDSIEEDTALKDKTNTPHTYQITNNCKAYKYYMIKVGNSQKYDLSIDKDSVEMAKAVFNGYKTTGAPTLTQDENEKTKYSFTMPSSNVVVMANYLANYKVTYDVNGAEGTAPVDEGSYTPGATVTVKPQPDNMKMDGYKFAGWTTDLGSDSPTIYNPTGSNNTFTINSNVILYAVWKETSVSNVVSYGYDGEYDGQEHGIEVLNPTGTTVKYRTTANGEYNLTESPKEMNVGTYTVYYEVSKDGLEPMTGSEVIKITQRPISLKINDKSKEYGSADPAVSWDDFTISSGSYAEGDTITVTRAPGEVVGKYQYNTISIKNGTTEVNGNYNITLGTMGALTINKKVVKVSGIKANSKIYDGNTTATLDYTAASFGKKNGDDLSVTAKGTFDNKNVGTEKTVTISDIKLEGTSAGNYELATTGQQKDYKTSITKRKVVISGIVAKNKPFDGNTTATLDFDNIVIKDSGSNEVLNVDKKELSVSATGTFVDSSLAQDKIVNISNLALTGNDSGNYELATSGQQTVCTASIVNAAITVSGIKAINKVYDGNNVATLDYSTLTVDGLLGDDVVTVTAKGMFVDKTVGADKRVAITNIELSGKDANKYALANKGQQVAATATITKKKVTVTLGEKAVSDKEYDGTTTATLDNTKLAINGVIAGDELKIATAAATFADNKVGENKNVSISGITLSGADVANYEIESGYNPTTTASITAKPVTVTGITASDKIYDGNTTASLDSTNAVIDGIVKGDNLTFTITGGTFADKKVGKDKTVTISGLTLSGTSAANYVLSADQSYTTSADLNARPVVVSGITAKDKSYDGDESVEFKYDNMTINGVVEGDKLTAEAEGSFTDKERGNDKTVVITKITLAGEDSANYVIDSDNRQIECKAAIKGIPIVVSGIQAKSKTYDGKTNAELDFSGVVLSGKKDADKVTISAIGDFEDKNAGENKKVNLKSVQLTGVDSGNYELAEEGQQESCKADIKPISVNVSGIAAENKVYDGNDEVTFKYDNVVVDGKLKSDKVDVKAVGAFVDKYPGTDKEVVISDISLEGTDGGNYVLAENGMQKKTVADITIANDKVNDDIKNEDGSTTHKEVEYKDGEPTGKVKEVTYDDNGVSLIEKTTYDESGEIVEKSVAISFDDDGEISQVIVKDAEGNELVATGETEITYGSKDETVGEIVANLKAEGIEGNEKGSVLDSKDITPDEMAYLLNDESTTMELLNEAVNTNDVSVKGGANVDATGFGAGILTDKAEILKNVLTPTELVRMLSSADTTNVVVEFKEEAVKNKAVINAKKKIDTLIGSEEDVYYFGCDMYKSVAGDADKTNISEFGTPIKLGLSIPEALRKQGRSFRLLSSHEDSVTGELTAYVLPLEVDENYNASFTADKLCLMALTYTDDDIKARKISEQEAVKKAEEEKQAAAQKEAADKKAAEEKEAADKKAAEEKAAAEKTEAEKKMAEQMKAAEEKEAVANAIAEIYSKLATAKKEIDTNTALDDTAKAEAKKIVDAAAASAKNLLENKGSTAKKSAVESFNNSYNKAVTDGKNATDIRVRSTVTAEEMDKNSISINSGLKVDQKTSVINVYWGKVGGAENYDVYVQYCGSAFLETPDATLSSDVTSAEISMVGGKKLNLKKNYKIYVNAYRTVEGKKIVLAKTITAHVVGRKNAVYTNAKGIKIKSAKTLDLDVNGVSVIKAKTNLVNKSKKKLTDAHAKEFRYASSDKKVATVSKSGVIKAVGSGTCTIYVYARNGYAKKIKVTVK